MLGLAGWTRTYFCKKRGGGSTEDAAENSKLIRAPLDYKAFLLN